MAAGGSRSDGGTLGASPRLHGRPVVNVGRPGQQAPPGCCLLQRTDVALRNVCFCFAFFFPEALGLGNLNAHSAALLLLSISGMVKVIKSPVRDLT